MTPVHWSMIVGFLILGAAEYWTAHGKDVMDARLWIGLVFAAIYPVGTYLVGLYQTKPNSAPPKP